MKELYERYKYCVVQITVKTVEGDLANGTGFHIGDGYIVTARHVIENNTIESIVGNRYAPEDVTIKRFFYPSDSRIDLAVLETDFSLDYYLEKVKIIENGEPREKVDCIPLGSHLDDWIGDELVLSKVLVLGYSRVPLSIEPVLIAAQGEINAVIDPYIGLHPHFIISCAARGGFRGGPVISEYDFLLGVFTEFLIEGHQVSENGFASVLSIEPLLVLLHENKICINGNHNILDDIL